MCTSATGKGRRAAGRTAAAYLGAGLFCGAFANLYALFGHGVRSPAMDLMFLYPLLGGALPFFVLSRAFPRFSERRFFRPARGLYSSGIAALTAGSLLRGIVEIAGTASPWIGFFGLGGAAFVCAGIVMAFLP